MNKKLKILKMVIFCPSITPRIKYTFDFVFKYGLNIDYIITDDGKKFDNSSEVKFSYGKKFDNFPYLPAHELLFVSEINLNIKTEKIGQDDIIALFSVSERGSEIDFDVLASVFFLISRYEEYLPCVKDAHGRYSPHQSVAVRYGFLDKLMVNRYIDWIGKWIKSHYIDFNYSLPKSTSIITLDIDHPFYNSGVSLTRKLGRIIKNKGLDTNDPFDNHDEILSIIDKKERIFFLLCNKETGGMDSFVNRKSDDFIALLDTLKHKTEIGIHPSYFSEEKTLISEEKQWLESKLNNKVTKSRQHFLRFDIETTFHKLNKINISDDYSMSYSKEIGWRASTNIPFCLFDLKKNKKLNIKIHSPCIMDATFKYSDKTSQDFEESYRLLFQECLKYGGEFIPIFHNDILSESEWMSAFKNCINTHQ